jgi:nucleoid-associated protein YgaU
MLWVCFLAGNIARAQDETQDVAEAARQARARKAAQGQTQASTHVYTNEDLQRARILVDGRGASGDANATLDARTDAKAGGKKKTAAAIISAAAGKPAPANSAAAKAATVTSAAANATATSTTAGADAQSADRAESLGEVARRYRREKAAREAERASHLPTASPFHMEMTQPALAEIAPRRITLQPAIPRAEKNRSAEEKMVLQAGAMKRDPFSRRVVVAPQRRAESPVAAISKPEAAPDAIWKTKIAAAAEKKLAETREELAAPRALATRSGASVAVPRAVKAPSVGPASVTVPNVGSVETPAKAAQVVPATASTRAKTVVATRTPRAVLVPREAVAPPHGAATVASAAPVVPMGTERTVAVRAGDSLWRLSRRYMGSGARWREWMEANPGVGDPRRLQPGMTLVAPKNVATPSSAARNGLRSSGSQTVLVRAGDSLWRIARQRYGQGSVWPCVLQANPDLPGGKILPVGVLLSLPETCRDQFALRSPPALR